MCRRETRSGRGTLDYTSIRMPAPPARVLPGVAQGCRFRWNANDDGLDPGLNEQDERLWPMREKIALKNLPRTRRADCNTLQRVYAAFRCFVEMVAPGRAAGLSMVVLCHCRG